MLREALVEFVQARGWRVLFSAERAPDFLTHAARQAPRVALIDPFPGTPGSDSGESGLETLRQLRQWHPEVKALVVSERADPKDVERAMEAGACGYVDKRAMGLSGLANAIESVGRGERIAPLHGSLFWSSLPSAEREPRAPAQLSSLSWREREVLRFVAAGADNIKIAALLSISERTVRAHMSSLYRKLGSENRTQLALLARRLGVIPTNDV